MSDRVLHDDKSVLQEDTTILNVSVPNNRESNYMGKN